MADPCRRARTACPGCGLTSLLGRRPLAWSAGAQQAPATDCPGPEPAANGVDGLVQGALPLALPVVEEVSLNDFAPRQGRRSHAQQAQGQDVLVHRPLEELQGGLPKSAR